MVLADTTWQLRRFQTISRFPFDPATEVTRIAPEVQTAIAFIGITRLKPEPDGCEITQWRSFQWFFQLDWYLSGNDGKKKRKRKFFDLSTSHTTFLFTKIPLRWLPRANPMVMGKGGSAFSPPEPLRNHETRCCWRYTHFNLSLKKKNFLAAVNIWLWMFWFVSQQQWRDKPPESFSI